MTRRTRRIMAACLAVGVVAAGTAFAWQEPKPGGRSERKPDVAATTGEHGGPAPILVPPPDGADASPLPYPPTEEEIWAKATQSRQGDAKLSKVERANLQFLVEKIGEKVDPIKTNPPSGPRQLARCRYKCTVRFDETTTSEHPVPFNRTEHRVEVVYIDKDHLRPVGGPGSITEVKPADPDQRLANIEKKLDRILGELEALKAVPRDAQLAPATASEPIMAPEPPEPAPNDPRTTTFRGRVTGPDGGPVADALVKQTRGDDEDFSTHTDADGRYVLTVRARPDGSGFGFNALTIEAPGLARQVCQLPDGTSPPTIRLKEGATISGRILYRGKTLDHVQIQLVHSDSTMPLFLGGWQVQTDGRGRFRFKGVPKDKEYDLFFTPESLQNLGGITPCHVRLGPKAIELDVSDVEVGPAHRLAGRLEFSDGRAIPEGTIAYVGIKPSSAASVRSPVDEKGRFAVGGLPTSAVVVWFDFGNHAPLPVGYILSLKNRALDQRNNTLLGRIDRDLTGLVVLFEPGQHFDPQFAEPNPANDEERCARPLAGVESVK